MKTSALRKRHKKKTKRITKRLELYNVSDKKRARNEKRKGRMEKKGTWSKRAEKIVKRKIKDKSIRGMVGETQESKNQRIIKKRFKNR
jgi:hypothetical protein